MELQGFGKIHPSKIDYDVPIEKTRLHKELTKKFGNNYDRIFTTKNTESEKALVNTTTLSFKHDWLILRDVKDGDFKFDLLVSKKISPINIWIHLIR